jgi:ATP-dependent Lon protease
MRRARGEKVVLDQDSLAGILGAPLFDPDDSPVRRVTLPGVSIGLSAGAAGGHIMFVEVTRTPGNGAVRLTGNLGVVIKESAHIALGWVRRCAEF